MRRVALCLFVLLAACAEGGGPGPTGPALPATVHVILFGDSNTDIGWDAANTLVEASYISDYAERLSPTAPNGSHQLSGKLDALSDSSRVIFKAINHSLSGTGTGFGRMLGDHNPSARFAWNGVTRFEAEVLGLGGTTWTGGTPRARVQAIRPTPLDYVYVSLGTNDWLERYGDNAEATIVNLTWMADRWRAAGLPASHFILTTLPPRLAGGAMIPDGTQIPAINYGIRQLARAKGLTLLDLSAYTSSDDGYTWRAPALTIDGVHYTEPVRAWIASQIAAIVTADP